MPTPNEHSDEKRSFTLRMNKAHKHLLLEYVDHITKCAEELNRRSKDRFLYTNSGHGAYGCVWSQGIVFKHPSTFDTLALEPAMKARILSDLDRFSGASEFYARVGRPWKRGYLLYGPPGTGKSSLIAAIANYMKYDVYDLELTKVQDNSELRALLLQTTAKSIIVIEDIDCGLHMSDRHNPRAAPHADDGRGSHVTLSGLLNFTDGLWSSCEEERIVIYTSNHKEMLDPALLRSGRMDMHILLSYCSFPAFKTLAFNYLLLKDHSLFSAVEQRMTSYGAQMTPADITEILIHHVDDPLEGLNAVISALDAKLNDTKLASPFVCETIHESNPEAEADADCALHLEEAASKLPRRRCAAAEQADILVCSNFSGVGVPNDIIRPRILPFSGVGVPNNIIRPRILPNNTIVYGL